MKSGGEGGGEGGGAGEFSFSLIVNIFLIAWGSDENFKYAKNNLAIIHIFYNKQTFMAKLRNQVCKMIILFTHTVIGITASNIACNRVVSIYFICSQKVGFPTMEFFRFRN